MQSTYETKQEVGHAGEILTLYYLNDVLKKTAVRSQGFDREKDFIINGKLTELKTDILATKTGNIAIEHRSLETHTAPIILTLVPTWYWSKRSDLQHLITYWPDVVSGGDDARKHTLLRIDSEEFKKTFKKL